MRVARGSNDEADVLIVRVIIDSTITSLQFIYSGGTKRFLQNGAIKGGSYTIGDLAETTTAVLLCE